MLRQDRDNFSEQLTKRLWICQYSKFITEWICIRNDTDTTSIQYQKRVH